MRRAALLLVLLHAVPASAASVYLNGVKVDSLRDQEIKPVRSVRIDDKGDVHIDAPAFSAEQVAEEAVGKRYLLATAGSTGKGAEVDVLVNGRFVRTLTGAEEPVVLDISPQLAPGKNTVLFRARGPEDASLTVVIGEAKEEGEQVSIEDPVIEYKSQRGERTFTLNAR